MVIKKSGISPRVGRKIAKSSVVIAFKKIVDKPGFSKFYSLAAVAILAATTVFWSLLSALLHQHNADQLVNSYLFENSATFHGAQLPGSHTFLIKWPLFFLIKLFGFSTWTFVFFTVITALLTVIILAAIIYRVDRRPLVFGTICLALASALLLIPAEPAPGGLLPVNMAMLATRNLEYVLYIAAVALLIKAPRLRSPRFWSAVGLLALIIASDKLFLSLSLGGALVALVIYALSKGWNLVSLSATWLMGGLAAGLVAGGLLWWIDDVGLIHISKVSTISPYGIGQSLHSVLNGAIYSILGLFTNFGANPAVGTSMLSRVPNHIFHGLISVSGPALIINLFIFIAGLFCVVRLVGRSLAHNKNRQVQLNTPVRLSIILIWTAVASLAVFIFSNHYYPADARYLSISIFAVFIAIAAYASGRTWRLEYLVGAGIIIAIGMIFGAVASYHTYAQERQPLSAIAARDNRVIQALSQHHVKVLVGDYWRVIPDKYTKRLKINVMPLSDCTRPRDSLSSTTWHYDLNQNSFAYLLSLDKGLTDFPKCTLNQVIATYGRPNTSVVIAGDFSAPKEILLFYDKGAHKSAPQHLLKTPSTVLPITLDELPYTSCPVPSVMNIVAHQDDDLLFMNPDLLRDIQAGHCVRTIYITAGDAGNNEFYWLGREQGSEAAYSYMTGSDSIWIDRVVQLPNHQYITVANPRGNSRISLIFLHLPDGNPKGTGFPATNFESLAKLDEAKITLLHSVYSGSTFSSADLTSALTDLMHLYGPEEIRTQSNLINGRYPDHSDHMAVGRFVQRAYRQYEQQQFENRIVIPLKFYIGYPVHSLPEDVGGSDLNQKATAFFDYAKYDGGVCSSFAECSHSSVYGVYLKRQYQNSY